MELKSNIYDFIKNDYNIDEIISTLDKLINKLLEIKEFDDVKIYNSIKLLGYITNNLYSNYYEILTSYYFLQNKENYYKILTKINSYKINFFCNKKIYKIIETISSILENNERFK